MATDIERLDLAGKAHGIVKCISICHQGSRGENSVAMSLEDTAVHVGRETKIVSIYDEPLAQKMASLIRKNFLGLARMSFASD